MFKAIVGSGAVSPDMNCVWERSGDRTSRTGECMLGVRGKRVTGPGNGHFANLVALGEKGDRGCEDPNTARWVMHGQPHADVGGVGG